jgi:tRNA threonylcarbamoyladenosine biosynthesis protein TsaB
MRMLTILAIETSTELASAALLRGDQISMKQSLGVQTHSQTILPMVQSLLTQADILIAQCDAVAFGAGPGSFTGVRTACGIAQGLAFGADIPVIPVVTLHAMAHACRETMGANQVLAILDARMEEVYWAQYQFAGNAWHTVVAPTLSAASAVRPSGDVVACGNGISSLAAVFGHQGLLQNARQDIMPHAVHIAQLAQIAFAAGHTVGAGAARPLYLRNRVALTTEERLIKAI